MMTSCKRCGVPYMQTKSTSALVLTYCGILCEIADLGFSLSAFEKLDFASARKPALRTVEAAAERREGVLEFAA